MEKNYRIGLDVGIGSVGWAVLENDPVTEEPIKIIKLGVRTFSPNEVDKTGESTAKNRREKRGIRRRSRRKAFRRHRMKALFAKTFKMNVDKELEKVAGEDVYFLRAKGIKEKLSLAELAKVVLNILKRRGFKSSRRDETSGKEGALLKAIGENSQFLKDKGYQTIGEALFSDEKYKIKACGKEYYNIRNHGGDYQNCFKRDELKEEIEKILTKQAEFNKAITEDFKNSVIEIFTAQRTFDQGPGEPSPYSAKFEVGKCTFLQDELRAPKTTYTFEYFTALSKLNNLKVGDQPLTDEQHKIMVEKIRECESIKFSDVRKLLNIPQEVRFNLCKYSLKKGVEYDREKIVSDSEKSTFISLTKSHSIRKALGLESSFENAELIDEAATMLTYNKSQENIDAYIAQSPKLNALTDEQKQKLSELSFDKFGSLSVLAMKKIIPYLEKGERYDLACRSAGFNHSSFAEEKHKYLKGDFVEERLKDITSPVVKRAVNQTLKVLNAIIAEYGSPQFVNIELARDLSRDHKERKTMEKRQEENLVKNESAREGLREFGLVNPTSLDLLKYKLYKEQDCKSMYSGEPIDINRLFEPNYLQIDHILPFSRSMDDSYNNKVLVLSAENQNKGDQTPYEYFGSDEKKWQNFVARVHLLKNDKKEERLLKTKFGEEQQKEFISRNLNDTRYIARFMLNLMQDFLQVKPSVNNKKNVIRSVNGAVTSYLRKFWGINKIRDDGDIHHCIDAAVISTVSNREIQKVTTFNMLKEKFVFEENKKVFVSKKTGEVLDAEAKAELEKQGIDLMAKKLPPPYEGFVEELSIRGRVDYDLKGISEEDEMALMKLGYGEDEVKRVRPVFVSRMKTTKLTGAIHAETMMSAREYAETKNLIASVDIASLKIQDKPESVKLKGDKYPEKSIADYYRPEDDRLLYLKLKNMLVENHSIPKDQIIYKPRKNGEDGPVVKKVKVYKKISSCVITPNGAAKNDIMVRVDVFKKDGKFYLCPIYMSDVYAKRLPNKVIEINREWSEIDDSFEFLFSLCQNDLIKVTSTRDMKFSKAIKNPLSKKPDSITSKEQIVYYNGTGIAGANIEVLTNDRCYAIESLGVKTLKNIEKLYVDVLGNIYRAPKEERKGF